jgi:hypothetical protein
MGGNVADDPSASDRGTMPQLQRQSPKKGYQAVGHRTKQRTGIDRDW